MKTIITILLFTLVHFTSFATTYTSSGSESWSAAGFPKPVGATDTIHIQSGDAITLNGAVDINGVVILDAGCQISGTGEIKILPTGEFTNNGQINMSNEFHVDGSFFNYSYAYVESYHSDGYTYNSGLIKLEPNEEYKHHGGELEGCGTILADYLNIGANVGVSLNGRSTALTTCQNFCNVAETDTPTFNGNTTLSEFLNNTDTSNSIIDSTITICAPSVLPVTLIEFNLGLNQNNQVELAWTTASEENNEGFQVQRSVDGFFWSNIDYVPGAGNSNEIVKYSSLDEFPVQGEAFYRLKQQDYDGTLFYSDVKRIDLEALSNQGISVYPNPSSSSITVRSASITLEETTITSLLGEDLTHNVVLVQKNNESLVLDISDLKPGMYVVSFRNQQFRLIKE
ncbi:MAG: T9SS type A sorting domain-containing protein [Bacteroidia bacterium]